MTDTFDYYNFLFLKEKKKTYPFVILILHNKLLINASSCCWAVLPNPYAVTGKRCSVNAITIIQIHF